ncbi:hypothetical protein PCE1_002160 [Barthelona sp. PCE]
MEVELKLILSYDSHYKFRTLFREFQTSNSFYHNLFFDNETQFLRASKSRLRLRMVQDLHPDEIFGEKEEEYLYTDAIVCVKSKGKWHQDVHSVEEIETHIDPSLAKMMIENPANFETLDIPPIEKIKTLAEHVPFAEFVQLADFENTRKCFKIPHFPHLVFELDESVFPNGERRYELEVEFSAEDASEESMAIKEFLDSHDIEYEPATTSKSGRLWSILGLKNKKKKRNKRN